MYLFLDCTKIGGEVHREIWILQICNKNNTGDEFHTYFVMLVFFLLKSI